MQNYLYLDSTDGVVCGLLQRDKSSVWSWKEFKDSPDQKGSALLHGQIHELLQKHEMGFDNISGVILGAGPGSYTGMRLTEGLAQIFEWQKIQIFTFYHFEVPFFCGYEQGAWFATAFKGETFIYSWANEKIEKQLIKNENLDIALDVIEDKESRFIHRSHSEENHQSSFDLISKFPTNVFEKVVLRKLRQGPYYFREIEKEFSVKGSA